MGFDNRQDYLRVTLHNICTEARCGVHPWERHPERPNRLRIDVDMYASLDDGPDGRGKFVDYDHVRDFIKTFPNRPHTDLLETLADEIVEQCFRAPRVEACRVSILKLDIFNEAEGAGIEMHLSRQAWMKRK